MEKKNEIQVKEQESYNLTVPIQALELANQVEKLIVDKKLFSNIQGKRFVNVEGWQFAGLSFGLIPMVTNITDLSKVTIGKDKDGNEKVIEREIKYSAEVELVDNNGIKKGYGYAICSNTESTKKYFQEYAICSMAQTRAVGKAYRNCIAWLMKASGFETTPLEEMDEVKHEDIKKEETKIETKIEETKDIQKLIDNCKSADEINKIYKDLTIEEKKKYYNTCLKVKAELSKKTVGSNGNGK